MRRRRNLARQLLARLVWPTTAAALLLVAACVGDDPVPTPSTAPDSGLTDTTSDGGPNPDTGTDGSPTPCTAPTPKELPAAGTLAWTGSGWGLAWIEQRGLYPEVIFATLDATGGLATGPTQVTTEVAGTDAGGMTKRIHGVVWANSNYAVLWSRDVANGPAELFLTLVASTGAKQLEKKVSDYAGSGLGNARLEFTKAEIAIVWLDPGIVKLQRFTPVGEPFGAPSIMASGEPDGGITTLMHPAVAHSTAGYGVAWAANFPDAGGQEIFYAHADNNGVKSGPNVRITNASAPSLRPVMVSNGSGFAMAWEDQRLGGSNHELFFVRVSAVGAVESTELRATNDTALNDGQHLVWTGTEYGLLWNDARDGNREVYLARIDGLGNTIVKELRVTTSPTDSNTLGVWWRDDRYRAAWSETPVGGGQTKAYLGDVCP